MLDEVIVAVLNHSGLHADLLIRRVSFFQLQKTAIIGSVDVKGNTLSDLSICQQFHRFQNPFYLADNLLNREFKADKPNQKWLTDVTEFKYYVGIEVKKVYLSAILDLYDRRIVSYVIRDTNDNPLVFDTFRAAIAANPDAHPLSHSDRGFQYTNRVFHHMLIEAGMTQSMSRVAKCIDNGPMEGFWGILKRERYYGKRFTDRASLIAMIEDFIQYYNTERLQRSLGVLTPMEKHDMYFAA